MKPYQRRAAGKPTYYKLAVFDPLVQCYRDGKKQFDDVAAAVAAAKQPGRYAVSIVDDAGRREIQQFTVGGNQ